LALVGVTAIWGWSFVEKHSLQGMAASTLNAWTFLIAALTLLPFAIRPVAQLPLRDWGEGLLAGSVLFVAFGLQTKGIPLTTPSNAGFITGLAVVFTPLLIFISTREVPKRGQMIGAGIALVGLGLLSASDFSVHYGDLLILCCAVFFAIHIVVLGRGRFSGSPLAFAFVQLVTVGVLSLAWAGYSGEMRMLASQSETVSVVTLAIFSTGLAYLIQTKAQSVISPQKVALTLLFEPLFSGVFGYLLAGDRLTIVNLVGAALIMIGLTLSEIGSNFVHGSVLRVRESRMASSGKGR
jgi:drug/metabolite transporter (DMT)-like permease